MAKNTWILTTLITILVIGFAGYQYMTTRSSLGPLATPASKDIPEDAHVITLTEDGFVPDEITIKKGEIIAFVTTTGNLFWPASNLHPSHLVYPEFDPMEPVQPDSVWSYTFEKLGEWKFHDHLAPYFTGTITVTE